MSKNKNYRVEDSGETKRPKKRRKVIEESEESEELEPYLECCVCMRSDLDDLAILVDNEAPLKEDGFHPTATLADCDEGIPLKNTIFLSCCRQHGICHDCMKTISTNFDNHPIGPNHSLIPCPYPFDEGCKTPVGTENYFTHSDVRKILDETQYQSYITHAERFQFPGYEIVKCPRPIIINEEGEVGVCGAWVLIPIDLIKSTPVGYLIMECDQNPKCYRRSCYHCHSLVRRNLRTRRDQNNIAGVINSNDVFCERCVTSTENTNRMAFNRYFYKPNKQRNDGQSLFFRNEEIPDETVLAQLTEMVDSERLYTRCMECLTTIYKTEQCNTITHCGIERCYACGRSGTREQDLGDHWDVTGVKGCPRFDHSNFWNEWGNCDFKCREGLCYSDTIGNCTVAEHQRGINTMIELRKRAHIYHAIKSLLPEQRESILKQSSRIPKLRPYLPRYMCSEYRTYLSDIVFQKILHAQRSLLDLQSSITNIEQELLRYRDTMENLNQRSDTPSLENSDSFEFEFTDDEEILSDDEGIFVNDVSEEETNNQIREYQTIIDKLSFLEFDKIDYPGDPPAQPRLSEGSSAFERLKQKYLP
jgi:hypothetical protein